MVIFVPNNCPSLKNSKVKTSKGVFSSKTVKKYLGLLGIQTYSSGKKTVKGYVNRPNQFEALREQFNKSLENKEFPVLLGFHFVRDSKRASDFGNMTEIIFDLLTAHDIIPDDNVKFVFPVPMTKEGMLPTEQNFREHQWISIDKEGSGVYLKFF